MRQILVEIEYNFESDVESHINAEELSELSDVFEDDVHNSYGRPTIINKGDNSISLDEISYNRDVNMINVPTASKIKTALLAKAGRRKGTDILEEGFSKRKQADSKRETKEKPPRKERTKKDNRAFDRNADDDLGERKVSGLEESHPLHMDNERSRSDKSGAQRQKPPKRDKQQSRNNEDREIDELLDSQRPAIAPVLGDSLPHKSMPNAFPRNIAKGLSDIALDDVDGHGSNEEGKSKFQSKGRKHPHGPRQFDTNEHLQSTSDQSYAFRKGKGNLPPSASGRGHHQQQSHHQVPPRPPYHTQEYPRGDPRSGRGGGRNGYGAGRGRGYSGRMSGRDGGRGRFYPSYATEDSEYYAQYYGDNGYDDYGGYYLEDGSYYPGGSYDYNYGQEEYGYGDYCQLESTYSYGQSEVSGYFQGNDFSSSQKPSYAKKNFFDYAQNKAVDKLPQEEDEVPQRIVTPAMVEADLAAVASLNPKAQEFIPNFSFR